MPGNLKSRLSRLREARALDEASKTGPREGPSLSAGETGEAAREHPAFLEGWENAAPFLWRRELRYAIELPPAIDPLPLAPLKGGGEPVEAGRLRFFDLETTGLSGGTGTVAFLAAIGRPGQGGVGLVLTQLFLADFPGEADFLESTLAALGGRAAFGSASRASEGAGEAPVIASYNGKAFDLPLLRTRCVMNGLSPPDLAHLDLLHASRRLWRSVHGGASLSLLEEAVLGRERGPDVPGALIPSMWLDFAGKGRTEGMELVLSHNAEDVVALALLCAEISRAFAAPADYAALHRVDRYRFGRSLLAAGRGGEGEALLEAAAAEGDEAAAILLSRRYARAGRRADRARVVGFLGGSFAALVEKAKYYEHSAGDYAAALACVDEAERLCEGGDAGLELGRRRRRLLGKLG